MTTEVFILLALKSFGISMIPISVLIALGQPTKLEKLFKALKIQNTEEQIPFIYWRKRFPWGIKYTLHMPRGVATEDILKHKVAIEEHLDAKIKLQPSGNRKAVLDVITLKLPKEIPFKAINTEGDMEIPVGIKTTGNAVINLEGSFSNLLIGGMVGGGKSCLLRVIILYLVMVKIPRQPKLYELSLIDLKGGMEFNVWRNCKYVKTYIDHVDDVTPFLESVRDEIEERTKILRKSGCVKIERYNAKHKDKMPNHMIIFDEFARYALQGKKKDREEKQKLVGEITALGRAVGIKVILATQRPEMEVVSGLIKVNFASRVAFTVAGVVNSEIILDHKGAEELRPGGMGILQMGIKNEDVFQAYWVPDDPDKIKAMVPDAFLETMEEDYTEVNTSGIERI
jgi:S-DNA-T family DNA segregation ATPase FtsK/SpoIIIE